MSTDQQEHVRIRLSGSVTTVPRIELSRWQANGWKITEPTVTIEWSKLKRLLEGADSAKDFIECNCSGPCEGTCTHSDLEVGYEEIWAEVSKQLTAKELAL